MSHSQDVTIPQYSSPDDAFIDALIRGDEPAARAALASGADVNATDAAGRSSLACALTGDDWENIDPTDASFAGRATGVVRLVVTHPRVSLYSLNAPQDAMRGVTPLGVAAWSNLVDAVRVCLEAGAGAVAVDAPDAQGCATPLMYASRDGRREMVELLLAHGARPEARDVFHRSALQYARPHVETVWRLEEAVRTARISAFVAGNRRQLAFPSDFPLSAYPGASISPSSQSSSSPSPSTLQATWLASVSELVDLVITSNTHALRNFLFPPHDPNSTNDRPPPYPYVVNYADEHGWSPVHYCCSVKTLSVEVLDALFLAGAEVSLFSRSGDCTPLHCLARKRRGPDSLRDASANARLYDFVVHLVRDLEAPLAAVDAAKETCIHTAAEHGDSAEVLRAMLDCDEDRTVRELKNSRGLTALEIAKPEFRAVFGIQAESMRSGSPASHLTVTPFRLRHAASTPSMRSESMIVQAGSQPPSSSMPPNTLPPEDDAVSTALTPTILALRWISSELALGAETQTVDLDHLDARLRDAQDRAQGAFAHFLARIQDVTDRLTRANTRWRESDTLLDSIQHALEQKLKANPGTQTETEFAGRARSSTTFSADSQRTAVSVTSSFVSEAEPTTLCFPSVPPLQEDVIRPESPYGRLKNHKSMNDLTRIEKELPPSPTPSDRGSSAVRRARAGSLVGPTHNAPDENADIKKPLSTRKLKAWLRKKLSFDRSNPPPKSRDPLAHDPRVSLSTLCETNEDELEQDTRHPVLRMLGVVQRDLARVDEASAAADKKLQSAARGVRRAERLTRRAIERRAGSLDEQRLARRVDAGLQALLEWEPSSSPANPPTLQLDISSATSMSSVPSPVDVGTPAAREAPTVVVADEDDTSVVERIVWWKVHERIEDAEDEARRIETWLDIVDDVLHGAREREGLPAITV